MSVMGGDWSGEHLWFGSPDHDTFFVPEVYIGIEYSHGPVLARVVYEYLHWQSKMIGGQNSTVSFDGVGCHVGFSY